MRSREVIVFLGCVGVRSLFFAMIGFEGGFGESLYVFWRHVRQDCLVAGANDEVGLCRCAGSYDLLFKNTENSASRHRENAQIIDIYAHLFGNQPVSAGLPAA